MWFRRGEELALEAAEAEDRAAPDLPARLPAYALALLAAGGTLVAWALYI